MKTNTYIVHAVVTARDRRHGVYQGEHLASSPRVTKKIPCALLRDGALLCLYYEYQHSTYVLHGQNPLLTTSLSTNQVHNIEIIYAHSLRKHTLLFPRLFACWCITRLFNMNRYILVSRTSLACVLPSPMKARRHWTLLDERSLTCKEDYV